MNVLINIFRVSIVFPYFFKKAQYTEMHSMEVNLRNYNLISARPLSRIRKETSMLRESLTKFETSFQIPNDNDKQYDKLISIANSRGEWYGSHVTDKILGNKR